MLVALRKSVKSVFVKIFLFGILIISFGLWGIADLFGSDARNDTAAQVGEKTITARDLLFNVQQNIARFQLQQLDVEQLRQSGIVDISLQQLISQAIGHNLVHQMDITVHDDTIRDVLRRTPSFLNEQGQFDEYRFFGALSQAGLSEQDFVDRLRDDIAANWVMSSYAQSLNLGAAALNRLARWRLRERDIEFIRLPVDRNGTIAPATDEQLASFLSENAEQYRQPERRRIKLVNITHDLFMDEVSIDDTNLEDAFIERANEFQSPETRVVSQILFADQEQANKAKDLLGVSTEFADLPSALNDEDLSIVTFDDASQAQFPYPDLIDTGFALSAGSTSAPFETDFGWAIIKIEAITPALVQTLDDVADFLRQDLRIQAAHDVAFDISQQLDNRLGGGGALDDAAKELQLPVTISPLIDRGGVSDDPENVFLQPHDPQVLAQAFRITKGEQSLLLEGPENTYAIVEVLDIVPSHIPTLDDIKAQLQSDWVLNEQRRLSVEDAQMKAESVRSGAALATIASVEMETALTRENFTQSTLAFDETLWQDILNANSVDLVLVGNDRNDNIVIAKTTALRDATATGDIAQLRDDARAQLQQILSLNIDRILRKRTNVDRNNTVINSIL